MNLTDLTLYQAAALLHRGEITSVELTQACYDRIVAVDNDIRAFLTLTPELALEQARAADAQLARGERTPLLGVPLAVKDIICVKGVPCTCGSLILEDFIPPYDATVIEKLVALGAVLLGKTNLDEFAMGSSTENSAFCVTRNPWDLTRVPGGSSGGSAAAVAAGMAPGALGTDTGGSVRQPASFCGLVGLKPSYGRVSRYGLVAFASSLDQVGVLTRTVQDAAILLTAIAGHDPRDSTSMPLPAPPLPAWTSRLKGVRVGVPQEYWLAGLQPEVEQAVRAALDTLRDLGAELYSITLPHTAFALPVYYLIAPAEASANLARYDGVRYGLRIEGQDVQSSYCQTRAHGFGAEVKRRIMLGTYALSAGYYDAYYLKAQQVRTLIKRDFDQAFEQVDVIACPTAPSTAFKLGEKVNDPLQMYLSDIFTLSASLAGLCALSLPCGFDAAGLPIGLQLMAPAFEEARLLQVAHGYEQATPWHTRRPNLPRANREIRPPGPDRSAPGSPEN